MRIADLLLEYDENKINQLQQKVNASSKKINIIKLANELNQYVSSGELVFWILKTYVNGGISRWEDVRTRVVPNLKKYEILKRKKLDPPLEIRDINQIKSLSQLEDIVEKYIPSEAQVLENENEFYKSGLAKLLYVDDKL